MGPGFNNPMKIEYLIETMQSHVKSLESMLTTLSEDIEKFDKEQDKFIHNISIAQPINAREISSKIDAVNESAERLANAIDKSKIESQIEEYRQNIKILTEYYNEQYLKTVDENR